MFYIKHNVFDLKYVKIILLELIIVAFKVLYVLNMKLL